MYSKYYDFGQNTKTQRDTRLEWMPESVGLSLTLVSAVEYSHLSDIIIIKLFKFALLPSTWSSEGFRGRNSKMTSTQYSNKIPIDSWIVKINLCIYNMLRMRLTLSQQCLIAQISDASIRLKKGFRHLNPNIYKTDTLQKLYT